MSGGTDHDGERLQKLISRAGIASRRAAETMIQAGRVTVNGQVAELGQRADLRHDAVKVDGKLLQLPSTYRTLALNKPTGVVTTLSDPEGRRTVLDLVPPRLRKGLFPIGRLDFATEGLLLLTTDGDLAQRVGHPRYGCRKLYEVKVKGHPAEAALDRLRSGFRLHGRQLAPVEIERRIPPGPKRADREVSNTWWRVRLAEGKTRQIREMFQRIGHPVQRLRRTQIGPIKLHGLPLGGLRELGPEEIAALERTLQVGAAPRSGRGQATSAVARPGRRSRADAGAGDEEGRRGRVGSRRGGGSKPKGPGPGGSGGGRRPKPNPSSKPRSKPKPKPKPKPRGRRK